MVLRKAFVMSVHPGQVEEYTKRHNPIWPELEAVLYDHGVTKYSIFFLASTNQLFAYAEIQDDVQWAAIAKTEICQKWWKHMGDIMPKNEDHSPKAEDLSEVFHIEK